MTTFRNLLAATDFSADGNNAVRRAALLAREHGARLRIVHAVRPAGCPALREWFGPRVDLALKTAQARAALDRVALEIAAAYGVAAEVEVTVADALEALVGAAARAELVVLGRRGRALRDVLGVGGTAERMLRTVRRPLLVVRTTVERSYRRVLAAVDFTPDADAAVLAAAALQPDAVIEMFHAIEGGHDGMLRRADVAEPVIAGMRQRAEAGAAARLRRRASRLGLDTAVWRFGAGHGPAARSTLARAAASAADLVVVGKHGRAGLGAFVAGSVSSRVLAEADRDVLIVPRGASVPSRAVERQFPLAARRA